MNSEGIYAETAHLTPERIREYLDGKLPPAAMHEIEMHLLECDFCADAVEGFELSEKSHVRTERSLLALRKRLNQKLRQHQQPGMRWPAWSAAAGIALAIAGYVVIRHQEREEELLARSESFLQTGSNDTLLVFVPAEQEMINSEELIASNGAGSNRRQAGKAENNPPTTENTTPVTQADSFNGVNSAAARKAPVASNQQDLNKRVIVGYGQSRQVQARPEIGTEAYKKYLADSLRYPAEAVDKQIEGEVVVSFTVRPGGSPADFKIEHSLGYGCDEEAIRLIKEGPEWKSTVVKGGRRQPVKVTQTVLFDLNAGK